MKAVRPKKSLGQHFLKDLQIAQQIAATVSPYDGIPVLEVGPGMGVLTQFLLQNKANLSVVELDWESISYLLKHYPELKDKIIADDFLTLDLDKLFADKFCVIGNYPYNISTQIFFKILDFREKVCFCSGMIQKEVAERIASKPGKKAYGIISVLLQAWYDIEYLFTVDAKVFDPPPKVQSAVVQLTRNNRTSLGCDERFFKIVVKTAFNQRRKTMRNSLQPLLGKGAPIFSLPVFALRPEQLSVEEFVELTNLVKENMPKQQ
ncbi:ribosomal RNA small subunit methyltransferase A [Bacteroidales bacterium]|nr:ribosomal RNA small subunit methyltransferase A [Bacteroidales bacterium]